MYKKFYKRIIDLFIGLMAFITLLPVILIITILTAICQGFSNVFFLQERIGFRGQPFTIIKFKTMTDDKDEHGNLLPDTERQTAWGNFMRKCSLDELLQLINVIKGDMSIVGPRPFMRQYVADCKWGEKRRFLVRPGITGLAQICGRNELRYDHRFKYDVWYVKHLSFSLDFWIMIATAKVILLGRGVDYKPSIDPRFQPSKTVGFKS